MFRLTKSDSIGDSIEYDGVDIKYSLAYDAVLKCFELKDDDFFEEIEKIVIMFNVLVLEPDSYVGIFDVVDLNNIINIIFSNITKRDETLETEEASDIELYNFSEDAERIYSSFLKDYNIDLIDQQGKLSWSKFISLFNNLSDDTPVMQAIYYRGCELPQGKEYADERKRIRKMKKLYALKSHEKLEEKRILAAMEALKTS